MTLVTNLMMEYWRQQQSRDPWKGYDVVVELVIPIDNATYSFRIRTQNGTQVVDYGDGTSVITNGYTQYDHVYAIAGTYYLTIKDATNTNEFMPGFTFASASYVRRVLKWNLGNIGYYAFNNCTSLEYFTCSDKVTLIDLNAFNGCSALQKIQLPDTVVTIGNGAFTLCES